MGTATPPTDTMVPATKLLPPTATELVKPGMSGLGTIWLIAGTGLTRVSVYEALIAGMDMRVATTFTVVFAGIVEAAKQGDEVNLAGFGKFKVKDSPARQGRNPATGETIEIAASRKLGFSPAKQVKDALAT